MGFLTSIAAFIVAIGVLVTVHEYGHYLAARWMGIRVLRFSIGFGRPLYRREFGVDRSEFVIAAIPLGGYVKMLDERELETPLPESEAARAFNRQSLRARNFVVVAGPLANFLFAFVAYGAMFMIGVPGVKPVVGDISAGSPAALGGMRHGDEIIAVGGRRVQDWEQANLRLLEHAVRTDAVILMVRDQQGLELERRLPLVDRKDLLGEGQFLERLGITPFRPEMRPWIGSVERRSPASDAGLQTGDRVIAVDGDPVDSWRDWVARIQQSPEEALAVTVVRGDRSLDLVLVPAAVEAADGSTIGRIGAGIDANQPEVQALSTLVRLGPVAALWQGVVRTWEVSVLTLRVLARMIIGEASLKNIAGPVTIAEFAGTTALIGLTAFLGFLALISVSLGIINLLPVPVLDGGHLMFNAVEWVKGSAVSERTLLIGQQVGLLAIAALMTLALYNDFSRLLG